MKKFNLFVVLLTGMFFIAGSTDIGTMLPKPNTEEKRS